MYLLWKNSNRMALENYYVSHFPESRDHTKNSEEKLRHHASEKCRGGWQLGVDGVTAAGAVVSLSAATGGTFVPLPWYGVRRGLYCASVSGTPEGPRLLSPHHRPGWAAIFGATIVTAPGICLWTNSWYGRRPQVLYTAVTDAYFE
jgi:hypothetical protein